MSGLETMAIIGLIGGGVSAAGTLASGAAQDDAAQFQANQLDAKAKSDLAAAQREAQEKSKDTKLALSRVQAVAGASGFSATDTQVGEIAGDIAAKGRYQSLLDLYKGEDQAAGDRAQAEAARTTGKAARVGSYFGAAGTLLSSASTFYDKYSKIGVPKVAKGYG